jgi:hypothetical protein
MKKLTQKRLKELLHYDPETGLFYWKKKRSWRTSIGDIAGYKDPRGYMRIRVDHKLYAAHRLAFLYIEGHFPKKEVDHIDRNPSNNKWENLRDVSHSCNIQNRKTQSNNSIGIMGVGYFQGLIYGDWGAHIKTSGKRIFLGYFATKSEAVKARWDAEVKYNYPNCNTTSTAYEYLKERGLI